MKSLIKSSLPHVSVVLFFLILVFVYFYPTLDGKTLPQGDANMFEGMSKELANYGKPSGWTGSMFSGMPSYQITGFSAGFDFVSKLKDSTIGHLDFNTVGPLFMLLVTSYILFLLLGAGILTSVLGAVAVAFSSYNIILLDAGHITKAWALGYTPLIFAGMIAVFKKKWLMGFSILSLGLALQVGANHLQITYYTALCCFVLFIAFLISSIQSKDFKNIIVATGIFAGSILLAFGTNSTILYLTEELGRESIRGQAELTPQNAAEQDSKVSGGLDKEYAFRWSYGQAETFSLLVPNIMGGASMSDLDSNSNLYQTAKSQGAQVGNKIQAATYWGDQPGTSGPVYFGAVVCFLALLAFFIVPGKAKWWLLGLCIFFIFLSWGRNFSGFNDFMFYHFPFYSKFRTVAMALVIPGFIFPVWVVMALNALIKGDISPERLKKALIYALSITGGLCVLLWLTSGFFFNFQSPFDSQYALQYGLPNWYFEALEKDRKGLLQADAMRSLIFIVLAGALVFWYIRSKKQSSISRWVIIGLGVLILLDLWKVDQRYLNADKFVPKSNFKSQLFKKTVADEAILQDQSPSYRVLNLNSDIFNETGTSYYHKSIGGYHAAKLRRYQNLIEHRLIKEISAIKETIQKSPSVDTILMTFQQCRTLNMLNTKYFIYSPTQPPLQNPYNFGNAWFVQSLKLVDNPDQEMAALETLDPKTEAVADKIFSKDLNLTLSPDSTAKIELTSYAPNKLTYKSSSSKEGLAVFSEIYYKYGWKASIDGKSSPISRVDWTLRGLVIPAGEHQIEFVFDPDNVKICGVITTASSGIIVLLFFAFIGLSVYRTVKKEEEPETGKK